MEPKLRSLSDKTSLCQGKIEFETNSEKWRRLVKGGAIVGGTICVSLFIPFVHFFVPPACLAFGGWYFFSNLKSARRIVDIEGACPECGSLVKIFEVVKSLPHKTFCHHCRNQLYLE